jgi:DNA (cytosine-5)-methyltransferase 1
MQKQRGLTHGSLFSGIGGFDAGFEDAGIESVWQVEKEPFCIAILKTRFPKAERFNDVRECGAHNLRAVDIITAGFPCQDLSMAGKRAGLGGTRSSLFWEVIRILGELRPPWFVLENVPGLFSSGEGRDFAIVLNALDECGYGVAWRVLNSQFFGVAQRRRRVFIVGCFGKPCPTEVLFEREGGGWDFAESGETGENIAGSLNGGAYGSGKRSEDDGWIIAGPLGGSSRSGGFQPNAEQSAEGHLQVVAVGTNVEHKERSSQQFDSAREVDGAVRRNADDCETAHSHRVRNFAGLPKGLDSARYRALGNAVTKKVATWIGRRIKKMPML